MFRGGSDQSTTLKGIVTTAVFGLYKPWKVYFTL